MSVHLTGEESCRLLQYFLCFFIQGHAILRTCCLIRLRNGSCSASEVTRSNSSRDMVLQKVHKHLQYQIEPTSIVVQQRQ